MYLPTFTEYCPKCGAQHIRVPFTAKQRQQCRACGHSFMIPVMRVTTEKTKPFFRFTWEKVLAVAAIIVLVLFILGLDQSYMAMQR